MSEKRNARTDGVSIGTGLSVSTGGAMDSAYSDSIMLPPELQGRLALRPREAAPLIGVGNNRIYELCHREDFPAIHLSGNQIIIPVHALQQWLNEQAEGVR